MKVTNSNQSGASQGVWENIEGLNTAESLIENSSNVGGFQSEQPTESTKNQNQQGSNQITKRSEIDLGAQARATQLQQQFAQNVKSAAPQTANQTTSSTNRIYKDGVTDLVTIASSSKYSAAEKQEFFRDYMRASKENLRNLITGSELWPPELRQHVDAALISSEKLQERVAQEFTPAQQTQVLERLLGSSDWKAGDAISKIIEKTGSSSLDYITQHLGKMINFFETSEGPPTSSELLNSLIDRAKDLSPGSRSELVKQILIFEMDPSTPALNQLNRLKMLEKMFGQLTSDEKNVLFDKLQDSGEIPRLAAIIGESGRNVPISILNGLSETNVDFLWHVYSKLATDANEAGNKDLGNYYENNILQLKGWMENHYPNYVRKYN
jgi:hypothetical protein